MVASGISHFQLRGRRPQNPAYPETLKSLGDHIRKVRLDRALSQPEVAKQIGVQTESITNWELGHSKPQVHHNPKIEQYLGYWPEEQATTLGERIVAYRSRMGLRRSAFAKMIGIDEATLWKIERKPNYTMHQLTYMNILAFLQ